MTTTTHPDDEFIPSSNIIPGMDAPPRSADLPLARRCHRAHALRHGLQVDDPPGCLALPHFLTAVRPHPAPVARYPAGAYLASVLVAVVLGPQGGAFPGALYYLVVLGFGVIFILAYLIDRLLAPRLGGMLGTLVFPLAMTTVCYLNGLFDPFTATQTNPAYTQYGNLPLLQLLSVTGLWGITFLMSWLASVVNWAWERGFAWPRVRGGAALYAGLLALVLLFGGARLALFPAQASTVRVAGISPSAALLAAKEQHINQLPSQTLQALFFGRLTPAERQAFAQVFTQASAPVNDELFAQSLARGPCRGQDHRLVRRGGRRGARRRGCPAGAGQRVYQSDGHLPGYGRERAARAAGADPVSAVAVPHYAGREHPD